MCTGIIPFNTCICPGEKKQKHPFNIQVRSDLWPLYFVVFLPLCMTGYGVCFQAQDVTVGNVDMLVTENVFCLQLLTRQRVNCNFHVS